VTPYAALTRATWLASLRDRTTVFFTFAFPLAFLVLFGLIFHGQEVEGTGLASINFIAPGVLSWGIGNAAVFSVAFALMQWRRDDLLRLIWRTPTPLSTVLASRWTIAVVVGLAQTALFTAIALLPVFGLHLASGWPLALAPVLFGTTAFLTLGMLVGSLTHTPEAVAAVANIVMVPMAFLSGSFYPLEMMPGWLQKVATVLPLHYLNDGITDAFGGRGGVGDIALDCLGLTVFAAVFGALSARLFRWSNQT
jgi:ABC-2 type transport system permease protein